MNHCQRSRPRLVSVPAFSSSDWVTHTLHSHPVCILRSDHMPDVFTFSLKLKVRLFFSQIKNVTPGYTAGSSGPISMPTLFPSYMTQICLFFHGNVNNTKVYRFWHFQFWFGPLFIHGAGIWHWYVARWLSSAVWTSRSEFMQLFMQHRFKLILACEMYKKAPSHVKLLHIAGPGCMFYQNIAFLLKNWSI